MIEPMLHRVVVKPDDLFEDPMFKKAKAAGIQFARGAELQAEEHRVDTGVVVKIGPTAFRAFMREGGLDEVPLKVGDKVSFAKYAGKVMMYKDERFVVLNDEDVVAVIGGDDE